ncbi:putative csep0475 effector protein [Golovinomyces cichoracearum]|uniref:Putative csep0475 effector protein n=1 Tax=Golovinomyces cichoracearum TaxID=62708 RepID=A0A420HEV8_9PEZI|nr:putative csep0475 effector protein [Golovinomyces cichoracearum]
MRFLLVTVLISALSQGYVGLRTHSYRTLERRWHENEKHADQLIHKLPPKHVPEVDEKQPKEKIFRGLRCDQTLYAPANLKSAAIEGCHRIRSGKKTWSFPRFPIPFPIDFTHLVDELSEIHGAGNPTGPFYLYPIQSDGKPFKFGFPGPHRVIINRKCETLGAVIQVKTKSKCEGIGCLKIFRKKHVAYRSCEEDYRR